MNSELKKFRAKEEQPSILCFSDTMNRRPLPNPPGNETLGVSRLDEDSQLKEFEKLLQTSKNKDISEYIEDESMSFTREGLGRLSKRKAVQDEISVGLSKLAGIVLAFGEKIDRMERRLARVEDKLERVGAEQPKKDSRNGGVEGRYKAHTISSNRKHRHKAPFKKKGSSTVNLANSNKFQPEPEQEERIRTLEKETLSLKMKNKALKIDKNILMKMIKDMIDKNPENLKAIDHEVFMKTLEDQ